MLLDDLVDYGQAKTCPVVLGGIVGLEDLFDLLAFDAYAVVEYRYSDRVYRIVIKCPYCKEPFFE